MNAPVTTEATEVAAIEDALDKLLQAALHPFIIRLRGPDRGPISARDATDELFDSLSGSDARHAASELLHDPVGEALRQAVHTLGERLHEIGGMKLMGDTLDRVAARDPVTDSHRESIMDHRWSGIGEWMS